MDMRQWGNRGTDIYGQRLKANGELVGVNFRAIDGPAGNVAQSWPAVAWNQKAREWLVVFTDTRKSSTRGVDIYAQRLGTDGLALAPDFRIGGAEATGDEGWPAVVWNGTANDYFVVWEDSRRQLERGSDIYGQRVDATGLRVGPNFRISRTPGPTYEGFPAVAWNEATDRYLVAWQDGRREATRGWDIYAQYLDWQGVPVASNLRISTGLTPAHQDHAAVAANPEAGQNLVVWEDSRREATRGWDIYGQRVTG